MSDEQKFKRSRLDSRASEILQLPDYLYNVFSFLNGGDLNNVRTTCNVWFLVSKNAYFQETHCARLGYPHKIQLIREMKSKRELGQVELGYLSGKFSITNAKNEELGFLYYKNGLKHGEYLEYCSNKHIKKHCHYRDGKLHGTCEEFWTGQIPRQRSTYANGKLDGEYWYYTQKGLLKDHYFFKNGIKDGPFEIYFENRTNLEATGCYINGKLDGYYTEWYDRNYQQKKYYCHYVKGKYDGEYKKWHRNGVLEIDAVKKNNKTVSKFEFLSNGFRIESV